MAKFVYRMQSILEIKEKLEEQARLAFAQANKRLADEEEKLQKLQERKVFYEEQGRALQEDNLSVMEIMENRDAIAMMRDYILIQQDEVAKAEQFVEEMRQKLAEARMESKMHNKLKEKAFENFLAEEKAAESKEVDELTSYVYGQRDSEQEVR
ncbi:MAG: flagellar export protein FliJ [Lachnospiraceae bacterium]|nr:flagellar export protein FliJ [Lachnospiraceae bacterium]